MASDVQEIYCSENGDRWLLLSDPASALLSVRHEPNAASGGQPTILDVAEFLKRGRGGPEHLALLRLIGGAIAGSSSRPEAPINRPEQADAGQGTTGQGTTGQGGELPPELFARLAHPTVRLSGAIDNNAAQSFLTQVLPVLDVPGAIVVELFSNGGDADVGTRLAQEVRLLRERHGRDLWFLGKTLVASAAVTFMAAFPRDRRWLTRDATLLIHGRRMSRDLHLEGPLGSCRRVLEEMIADIDNGLRIEEIGFEELIEGSAVSMDEIRRRSYGGWYLPAAQALELGLVAGLI